jgi:hypothetical protein
MTKRYFKATIGAAVYFRASDTRVYASATIGRDGLTFSSKPAGLGWSSATEIGKPEYTRLVALKAARVAAGGSVHHRDGGSPGDSWVTVEAAEVVA